MEEETEQSKELGYIHLTIYEDDFVMNSSFDDPSDINWFLDLFKQSFLESVLHPQEPVSD